MFLRQAEDWVAVVLIAVVVLMASWIAALVNEFIFEQRAVAILLGEARGEGYLGMRCIAHVIRNRKAEGLPLDMFVGEQTIVKRGGVYFEGAKFIDGGIGALIEPGIVRSAVRAWRDSKYRDDITNGATHFENVEAFGMPFWARNMERTAVQGRHWFFKEKE